MIGRFVRAILRRSVRSLNGRSVRAIIARSIRGLFLATIPLGLACAVGPGASANTTPAKIFSDKNLSYTEPDLAVGPDGEVCLVWLAYGAAGDEILAAKRRGGHWGEPFSLSAEPGRYLSPRVAAQRNGGCFAVWAALVTREKNGPDVEPVVSSELFGRSYDGAQLGPRERLTEAPGSDAAPALAADDSGDLWLAWESFHEGRFDIHARKRTGGSWGSPIRVTDHPDSDSQPSVAIDAAGRVFVAWMSRRDADAGDENTEIYVRRIDTAAGTTRPSTPDTLPTRVSVSDRLDALPTLIATPTGVALVWTESYFASGARHNLPAILYGEAQDRGHRIAWLEGGSWTAPTASRPSPFVHERVTAIPGPTKRELWLLYDELNVRDEKSWSPTMQRVSRATTEEPFPLSSRAPSPGTRIAAAADIDGAWVATVAEVAIGMRKRNRSVIEVLRVEPSSLPPPHAQARPTDHEASCSPASGRPGAAANRVVGRRTFPRLLRKSPHTLEPLERSHGVQRLARPVLPDGLRRSRARLRRSLRSRGTF